MLAEDKLATLVVSLGVKTEVDGMLLMMVVGSLPDGLGFGGRLAEVGSDGK